MRLSQSLLLIFIPLLAVQSVTVLPTRNSSALSITVQTNKPSYQIGENIEVQGNLTYEGSSVQGKLVALEIDDPQMNPLLLRAVQTDNSGAYNTTFKLGSGAFLGTYTLTATANALGETATCNATFTLGQDLIADINRDGTVDISDAIILSNCFLTTPSSLNWNPNADINNDGIIDISDAIILSGNFLVTIP
jgi:hypothetical protein